MLFDICMVNWQTVEIKVKMDCDGCERKVRNAIKHIKGSYYHHRFFFFLISPTTKLISGGKLVIKKMIHNNLRWLLFWTYNIFIRLIWIRPEYHISIWHRHRPIQVLLHILYFLSLSMFNFPIQIWHLWFFLLTTFRTRGFTL